MERVRFLFEYLRAREAAGAAPDTLRHHHRSLTRFDAWMGQHGLSDMTVSLVHLTDFIHALKQKYPADHVNQYVSALRVYHRWLTEVDVRADNPAAKLKILTATPKPIESLTTAEIATLVRHIGKARTARFGTYRGAVMMALLLDTGMRIGEALRLKLGDVNFIDSWILVDAQKTHNFRKSPICAEMRKILKQYLQRRAEHLRSHGITDAEYLFPSEQGTFWLRNTAERCLKNIAKCAGITRVFYSHLCRRTFLVESLLNGIPMPAAMEITGLRKLSTVQRYTYMTAEQIRKVHAKTSPVMRAKEIPWVIPSEKIQ